MDTTLKLLEKIKPRMRVFGGGYMHFKLGMRADGEWEVYYTSIVNIDNINDYGESGEYKCIIRHYYWRTNRNLNVLLKDTISKFGEWDGTV